MNTNHLAVPSVSARFSSALLCGAALSLLAPIAAVAGPVKFTDCPKAVRKTIEREIANGRLAEIEAIAVNGATIYEADILLDGHEYELHVAGNGILIHKQLEGSAATGAKETSNNGKEGADDDAAAVEEEDGDDDERQASQKQRGQKDADEDDDEGDDDDDGDDEEDKDADDDEDGEADDDEEETTIELDDLPKAVRKTLKQESRGGEIEELEREGHKGRAVYEADVEFETDSGERVYEIQINERGVLLSKVLKDDEDEGEEEDDEEADEDEPEDDDEEREDEEHAEDE